MGPLLPPLEKNSRHVQLPQGTGMLTQHAKQKFLVPAVPDQRAGRWVIQRHFWEKKKKKNYSAPFPKVLARVDD